MGSKYASKSTSGYDSSPPSDDGAVTAANKITWASVKTKLTDVLKTFGESINSALVTALDTSTTTQSTAYTTVAGDHQKPIEVTGTTTISLGDASTMAVGYQATIVNAGTNIVTVAVITATDTLDGVTNGTQTLRPGESGTFGVNSTSNGYRKVSNAFLVPPGTVWDYAGATAPSGWLECDGSAVSRTTYADLYTAVSTTWGAGDGSTTFNLPDFRGRSRIGKGTGTVAEAVTASSSNGFTVSSNNTKWVTGMAVVLSNLTGFTTSASAGTYYIYRVSATNVRLCSTLAIAQNATTGSMETISGTGTATLTTTFTARTLAEQGGEETHAMSSTELIAHTHGIPQTQAYAAGGAGSTVTGNTSGSTTAQTGGNAGMNIMQPFAATMAIIKY